MTRSACDAARSALAQGREAPELRAHISACRACSRFAASLDAVDGALAASASSAAPPLDAALRARILASVRAPAAPAPRGRRLFLDWSLRATAAAAVLVAMVWAMPQQLFAAETDPSEIPRSGVGDALAERISALPEIADRSVVSPDADVLPLAAAAVVLLVIAGASSARRGAA